MSFHKAVQGRRLPALSLVVASLSPCFVRLLAAPLVLSLVLTAMLALAPAALTPTAPDSSLR